MFSHRNEHITKPRAPCVITRYAYSTRIFRLLLFKGFIKYQQVYEIPQEPWLGMQYVLLYT